MVDQLTPGIILLIIAAYFLVLISISYLTSKNADNDTFFIGGRKSPWILVAIGMVGASLSGVTFISIPGVIGAGGLNQSFSYMQMVFGYLLGYFFIANVLLPLYYRMQLTSIYAYLGERLGVQAYKIGSVFFLLSRTVGASLRLYLVAIVLHSFVLGPFGVSFAMTVIVTILLIWIYTFRGGIKTIVWTDTLQTIFMLSAVILTIISISKAMGVSVSEIPALIRGSEYSQLFYFDGGWNDPNNFFKQFISGALITIVMTGLDQDMMQKNLSCKSLGDAQKNMYTFSFILIFANLLFIALGALLYIYMGDVAPEIMANHPDLATNPDQVFPQIALQYLPPFVGIVFILGLIAAAYSSADSALTALTTSFCIDFLDFEKRTDPPQVLKRIRFGVHLGFSIVLLILILLFKAYGNKAVINELFVWAGLTYGPLLGLFAFGMFTKLKVKGSLVIPICVAAPIISFFVNKYSAQLLGGFQFGSLLILFNGVLTFLLLFLISKKKETPSV
ncbi:MAG: sodium:solute symporter [Saprospiraceae bacterium]